MLTIQRDPTGATGIDVYELDFNESIHGNIARKLHSGYGCSVYVNGFLIENPSESIDLQRIATAIDYVRVICRPEGGGGGFFGSITKIINTLTFGVIFGKLLTPKPQVPNQSSDVAKESPNNRLSGQTNVARAYQAIPDIYGQVRSYPDLIQPSNEYYINHVKYVTEWLCVGLGKYTRESIKSGDTPLGDISGSSVEFFEPVGGDYPENGVTTISGVTEPFTVQDVNGQELVYPTTWATETDSASVVLNGTTTFTVQVPQGSKWDNLISIAGTGNAVVTFTYDPGGGPVNFSQTCAFSSYTSPGSDYIFTFTSPVSIPDSGTFATTVTIKPIGTSPIWVGPYTLPVDADRFRTNIIFQRGLKGSVQIKTEWWAVDGNGDEIGGTRESVNTTYTADTYDYRAWSDTRIPTYGNARYRVRLQRITPEVGDGNDVAKLEQLAALRYYATKTLPGVTIAKIVTKATESATSFSERKFNLVATRHVRTIGGTSVSASRDFARAVVHQYVAVGGLSISDLDTSALTAIGDLGQLGYFDFTFDDDDVSIGERIESICNAARVYVSRVGLQYTFRRDVAQPYPVMQLDYRNLAASGDSALTYNGYVPGQFDGIELEYVDPTKNVRAYIRYRINNDGTISSGTASRPNKMKLAGCRNQTQANNRALLECRKLLYQRQFISDTILNDGYALQRGDLIRWVDPNDFYGDDGLQAGEVLAINGLNIATSEPIHWDGNTTARVVFTNAEGYATAVVTAVPHDDGFTVASLPTGVYVANGTTQQLSSRYTIGVGLSLDAINSAGLYTVTDIKPNADGTLDIEAAAYDSRIYESL